MNLENMTAKQAGELIKSKDISASELTRISLEKIESTDGEIGAFLSVYADMALNAAKGVDEKLADGEELSPLAGVPMAVKDNMCYKGTRTTCASKILENFVSPYTFTVGKKLEANDSVIVGKLNMDEFAMGSSCENSAFKKTRNPRNTEYVPGGSSGGSAATVAASQVFYALGSDTGGSIRQPASFCGVVGMKPTYGTVSRYGLVAFASSLDQIGPVTKTVEDCAYVMNVITGHDEMDSTSLKMDYPDYTKTLNDGVKGMKIGVAKEFFQEGMSDEVKAKIQQAIKDYEYMGAEIVEVSFPIFDYALSAYYNISSAEASSNLARFDGVKYGFRSENFETIGDIYSNSRSEGFGDEVKRRIILGTYVLSSGYYDAYYLKALKVRTLIKQNLDSIFKQVDLLLSPTSPTTAFKLGEKTDDPMTMYLSDIYTVPVNIAGVPAISIPIGPDSNNLPIGMQLIGKAFSEPTILAAANAYELEKGGM